MARRRGGAHRGLRRYVIARLGQSLFVLAGAVVISFVLVNLAGDPSNVILGPNATEAQRAIYRAQHGFDAPLLERLATYVAHAARGDLGTSYRSGDSALGLVLHALPNTLLLVLCAITLAAALAVPVAIYSVLHRESVSDRMLRRVLLLLGSLPEFWVALVLVLVFSVNLAVLPIAGFDSAQALILPSVSIALPLLPALVRLIRGALLDVAASDFVVGLRAKGFSDRHIMWHQGLKNAAVPSVTWVAYQLGQLIGGTLIIEIVFSWPGLGFLLNDAVRTRDVAVIQAIVIVVAAFYVTLNLLADLLVLLIDPRVRLASRA
jgi:ABC-type dipeptide/oligopeptide/nickel transport system permease component